MPARDRDRRGARGASSGAPGEQSRSAGPRSCPGGFLRASGAATARDAVRAALTWFSRDRRKGLVGTIGREARGAAAPGADPDSYDAAVDAVFEIAGKLSTGKGRFLGVPITDPDVDVDRAADAFPTLAIGLVLGLDVIGAREYTRATSEMSAAIGQNRILRDQDISRLRARLEDRESAGKPLSPGPAGHSAGLISRSLTGVPFSLICQVRDHLTIIGEAAAIRTAVMLAACTDRVDSSLGEPVVRQLEAARASSGALRAYLLPGFRR